METEQRHHVVVAISRMMASGGGYIGQQIAARMGCSYLDREILFEAAEKLNVDPKALEEQDGKKLNFWERIKKEYEEGFPTEAYVPPALHLRDSELFKVEKDIMRMVSARGPAIVVGRAGFHVYRHEPGLLSVFLYAPFEHRVEKARQFYFTQRNNLKSVEEAKKALHESDRKRADFIKSITGKDWLNVQNFHLVLDTSKVGWDHTPDIIYEAAMAVEKRLLMYQEVPV